MAELVVADAVPVTSKIRRSLSQEQSDEILKYLDGSLLESISEDLKDELVLQIDQATASQVKGQYDFCIICSNSDLEEVETFRDTFCSKYNLSGILETDEEMTKIPEILDKIEEMVSRSTIILVYITDNFNADDLCKMQKNELITQKLRDSRTKYQIVPLYTQQRNDYKLPLPFGLNGLTGFKTFGKTVDGTIKNTFNDRIRRMRLLRERMENKVLKRKMQEISKDCLAKLLEKKYLLDKRKKRMCLVKTAKSNTRKGRCEEKESLLKTSTSATFRQNFSSSSTSEKSEDESGNSSNDDQVPILQPLQNIRVQSAGQIHSGTVINITHNHFDRLATSTDNE